MAGSQRASRRCHKFENFIDLRSNLAINVQNGMAADAAMMTAVIRSRTCRHPDLLCAELQRDFDRGRIQCAHRVVEDNSAMDVNVRDHSRHKIRPLDCRALMRLDKDRSHPATRRFSGKVDVIVSPAVDVRRTMNVKVDGAFEITRKDQGWSVLFLIG